MLASFTREEYLYKLKHDVGGADQGIYTPGKKKLDLFYFINEFMKI